MIGGGQRSHSIRSASIVIPVRNARDTIAEQLNALVNSIDERVTEIVVVDSASDDDSGRVVTEFAASWPIVELVQATRPGANVARNAGVRQTGGDVVLLCDADDVVAEAWAPSLLDALETSDLVRGRYALERLNSPEIIAARGPVASAGPPPAERPLEGLGGNCGFWRSVWEEVGGMDETHYGSDDIEFFWRAQSAGFSASYVDKAVVHYRLRPSLREMYLQQRTWSESRALLLRDLGPRGPITKRPARQALRQWAWLAMHLPDIRSKDPVRQGTWVRTAAIVVGRLRGSIRHRAWYV